MKVRAKKSLGQHFLTDESIARRIVDSLETDGKADVLEVGPGMGVLTKYLLAREDVALKAVELDPEAAAYLRSSLPGMRKGLIEADFLKMDLGTAFPGDFLVIGNFPYNISSQIFFKVLDHRDRIPQVVGMVQKEVAERIAEAPGTKTYGILSVFLQAWYDIEYLFTVAPVSFAPPPKVQSAVIRLRRNARKELGCDEALFRRIVKASFGLRRKTMRNSLKSVVLDVLAASGVEMSAEERQAKAAAFLSAPVFELRPERLGVEDFVSLTNGIASLSGKGA